MPTTTPIEPRTKGTGRRAALTSVGTSAAELVLLSIVAFFITGPLLIAARWIIGLTGSSVGFVINRRWSFREVGAPVRNQAIRFGVTLVSAVTLATALFAFLLSKTSWDPRAVHVLCAASVFAVYTQPMLKGWVFAK